MLKRNNNIYIISYILIIFGILLIIYYFISSKIAYNIEINKINDYIKYTSINNNHDSINENNIDSDKEEYNMIIEIPKINLMKGIYDINSSKNNVDYNIEVLKESVILDNDINSLILASHNGNSKVSYFREVNKLVIDDEIYIYYNGNKYIYVVEDIYDVLKDGDVEISKNDSLCSLTLITCKNNSNDRQLVIISSLKDKLNY